MFENRCKMTAPIGQLPDRAVIINITNSLPCTITTEDPHFFPMKSFVRFTDLNGAMPVPRGEDELNNKKFRVIPTGDNTFYIQDPITFQDIDSTTFPPYVEGGSANLVQPNFVYYPSPSQTFPN
jgi:hypothetical protein